MKIEHATNPKAKARRSQDEQDFDVRLGRAIRVRRMIVGLSQEELGAAAGVITFQQVQKYESARNRISVSRLVTFATALDTTAAELIAAANDGAVTSSSPPRRLAMELMRCFEDLHEDRQAIVALLARKLGEL